MYVIQLDVIIIFLICDGGDFKGVLVFILWLYVMVVVVQGLVVVWGCIGVLVGG